MPYVSKTRAACLDAGAHMLYPGDLAYRLSTGIAEYLGGERELNFARIAEVRGAVAAALNEFERRVACPYEDAKLLSGTDPYKLLVDEALDAHDAALRDRIARHDEARHSS